QHKSLGRSRLPNRLPYPRGSGGDDLWRCDRWRWFAGRQWCRDHSGSACRFGCHHRGWQRRRLRCGRQRSSRRGAGKGGAAMKDWRNALVKPGMSIRETIGVIDAAALQLALVVTDDRRLLGTVTDGDIRRAILRGVSLEEPVESVMNVSPTVAYVGASRDEIHALLARRNLQHIPVVDDSGFLVDLVMLRDLLRPEEKPNWVVLMAGGEGTRLRPLTSDLPKPLLPVGSRP